MSVPPAPPPDGHGERLACLLAEQAWLRALAGALVRSDDAADDLTQETWLAALERPPASAASPRGWLATVLRRRLGRVQREAVRRRRRERAAARPEALPDVAALAAQADVQRRVLEAVLALPALTRDALLLRHQRGLAPAEIAARLELPLETVRTRLRRGLAEVRARLDAGDERGGASWRPALHGFLGSGPVTVATSGTSGALSAGGVFMAAKSWTLVGAAALLSVTGWALLRGTATTPAPDEPHGQAPPASSAAAGPRLEGTASGGDAPATPVDGEQSVSSAQAGVRLTGRVRLPDGRPAIRARIHVERADGRKASADADEVGAFVLEAGSPAADPGEWVSVVARLEGLAGVVQAWLAPAARSAGRPLAIDLALASPIRVLVRHAGRPVPEARVALATLPEYFAYALEERTTDAQGVADLGLWPRGAYWITAAGPGLGRGQASCVLPYEAGEVTVEMGEGRGLTVRVLEQGAERAVPGASVLVFENLRPLTGDTALVPYRPPPAAALTDAAGETRFEGLDPRAELFVVARASGGKPLNPDLFGGDAFHVRGWPESGVHVTRVILRSPRSWRVEAGELPVPADGTPVEVRNTNGSLLTGGAWSSTGEVRGGVLSAPCYFHGGIYAEARTPDGALARLLWQPNQEQAEYGQPTSFRRPRSVEVRVRTEGGAPVAGVRVQVGGLAEGPGAPRETDAAGEARFTGFWGRRHSVYVLRPGQAPGTTPSDPEGEVDLESGSASIEVSIGAERDVLVLGEIDGRPGLPPQPTFFSWAALEQVEADPTTGRARVRVRAQRGQRRAFLQVGGKGVRSVSVEVPVDGDPSPFEAPVRFERRLDLGARVLHAPDGESRLRLERWDEALGAWVVDWMPVFAPMRATSTLLLSTGAPGRHRLVDASSGTVGPELEIARGDAAPLLALDLSQVLIVEGLVRGPAGADLRRTEVLPEGAPTPAPGPPPPPPRPGAVLVAASTPTGPVPVDAQGRFRVRLPRGTTRTLVVRHPTLEPDPVHGRVHVAGPDPIELVLVEGASASLVLEPAATAVPNHAATVTLSEAAGAHAPVSTHELSLGPAGARFGGFRPGTYTLWLDVPPFAPRTLAGVTLGPGRTDLGRVALSAGARVRVRVLAAPGQPVPRINVAAYALSPRHWRSVGAVEARDPVELPGLGPGTYRLLVTLARSGERLLDEPLVVQGEEVLERTVDLGSR